MNAYPPASGRRSQWARWARLRSMRREAQAFALLAWAAAPVVEASLAAVGLRRTLGWIEAVPPLCPSRVAPGEGRRLVDGAYAAHVLRGRCLPRALVQYLLHRVEGTPVRLVVGVRRGAAVEAHAWVEGSEREHEGPEGFDPILVSGGARA